MPIKSSNEQGNKYHDENTGKFTSAEGGSEKKERPSDPLMDLFGSLGESLRESEKVYKKEPTEEEQASKLFGVDLNDNIDVGVNDLAGKMSYYEQLRLHRLQDAVDYSGDDIYDYLYKNGGLTEEELTSAKNGEGISPVTAENAKKYFDLDEFIDYIEDKYRNDIAEWYWDTDSNDGGEGDE